MGDIFRTHGAGARTLKNACGANLPCGIRNAYGKCRSMRSTSFSRLKAFPARAFSEYFSSAGLTVRLICNFSFMDAIFTAADDALSLNAV